MHTHKSESYVEDKVFYNNKLEYFITGIRHFYTYRKAYSHQKQCNILTNNKLYQIRILTLHVIFKENNIQLYHERIINLLSKVSPYIIDFSH